MSASYPARIITERMAAELGRGFVVFLIGMRINKLWKLHKWVAVARTMGPMIEELMADADSGLIHARAHFGPRNIFMVQYWASVDQLMDYAANPEARHRPAWTDFHKRIGDSGDVGIWHEAYRIQPGAYEAIYANMPPHGLGVAIGLIDAIGEARNARGRLDLGA